jgi:hypothetical protein
MRLKPLCERLSTFFQSPHKDHRNPSEETIGKSNAGRFFLMQRPSERIQDHLMTFTRRREKLCLPYDDGLNECD